MVFAFFLVHSTSCIHPGEVFVRLNVMHAKSDDKKKLHELSSYVPAYI